MADKYRFKTGNLVISSKKNIFIILDTGEIPEGGGCYGYKVKNLTTKSKVYWVTRAEGHHRWKMFDKSGKAALVLYGE